MKNFSDFFKMEAKRFICKRNVIAFAVLFAMLLVVTQFGINIYKDRAAKKKEMLKYEQKRMEGFVSYRSYGTYGFRMALVPSTMNIFFINTAPFGDMTSVIDTSERLKIYNLLQAESAFSAKAKWLSDFSGLLMLLGSLIAFLYGFETYYHTEYLKFLSSFSTSRRVFINIALSRLLLLSLLILAATALSYLLIVVNGIAVPLTWNMAAFFLEAVVMMSGFFGLGCWLGLSRSKATALLLGLGVWMTAIILPPLAIDMITNLKGNTLTSVFKIEELKFKILANHEKRFVDKGGKMPLGATPTEAQINEVLFFAKNDFPEIQALDEKLINEMERNISNFQSMSMLFPTTQYLAVNYELSSSGYQTLVEFYRTVIKRKTDFMRKFINIIYIEKKDMEKVKAFLKGEEQLFFSDPQVVSTFLGGLIISLLYFIGMMIGANRAYNKALFRLEPGEKYKAIEEKVELESGLVASFRIMGDLFGRQLFSLMMGKGRYIANSDCKIKISVDGIDIMENRKQLDFHYLPHIKNIPGEIRASALLSLLATLSNTGKEQREQILKGKETRAVLKKNLKEMSADELGKVFLTMLDIGSPAIYLFNNVISRISPDFAIALENRLFALADNENKLVVFIWEDHLYSAYQGATHSCTRDIEWTNTVTFFKKLKDASEKPQERDGKE